MLCCLLLKSLEAVSQDTLHSYKSISVQQAVAISADGYGNLYVADKQGNIHSYDSLGNYLLTYSPQEVASVTLIDARSAVRIFAFYRELQSFVLLNRFLTPIETYRFQLPDGGFVRVATQAADNTFWLYDDVSFSLKKFDKKLGRILLQTDLSLLLPDASLDIVQMAEYQNYLFLLANGYGILQFDNIGNFIRNISVKTPVFTLHSDAIFYYEDNNIVRKNLYNAQSTKWVLAETTANLKGLAMAGSRLITLEENLLRFWQY
ncbi:MAG: hypothetical protein RMJ87_12565 [Cytophagales bacterium]|nr:hypothetical protein [Bernardetiaceae bacterium]MDW8205854.1 hypothetical protein [Cytophagales bacterium]